MQKLDLKRDIEVLETNKDDLEILSSVLTKAFINDPMTNWTIKNDSKKLERIYLMYETMIKHFGLTKGTIYTNKNKNGASVWVKPENFRKMSFMNISLISSWIKIVGIERISHILKGANFLSSHQPTFQCYYLMVLGVEPEHQRKGLASALVKPVLDKCDKERIPAYLETSNIDNLNFYEKHGFRIKDEVNKPEILPLTWTLLREPQI